MELYKVKCSVFGKETVYTKEMLENKEVGISFLNFYDQLAVELIFWEKVGEQWVRITRKEFGKRFQYWVEVGKNEGDIVAKGYETEPVAENWKSLIYNPNAPQRNFSQGSLTPKRINTRKFFTTDDADLDSFLAKNGYPLNHKDLLAKMAVTKIGSPASDTYQVYVTYVEDSLEGVIAFGLVPSLTGTGEDVLLEVSSVVSEKDHSAIYTSLLHKVSAFAERNKIETIRAKQPRSWTHPELDLVEFKYTRESFHNLIMGVMGYTRPERKSKGY
jgi:hypothetical protein